MNAHVTGLAAALCAAAPIVLASSDGEHTSSAPGETTLTDPATGPAGAAWIAYDGTAQELAPFLVAGAAAQDAGEDEATLEEIESLAEELERLEEEIEARIELAEEAEEAEVERAEEEIERIQERIELRIERAEEAAEKARERAEEVLELRLRELEELDSLEELERIVALELDELELVGLEDVDFDLEIDSECETEVDCDAERGVTVLRGPRVVVRKTSRATCSPSRGPRHLRHEDDHEHAEGTSHLLSRLGVERELADLALRLRQGDLAQRSRGAAEEARRAAEEGRRAAVELAARLQEVRGDARDELERRVRELERRIEELAGERGAATLREWRTQMPAAPPFSESRSGIRVFGIPDGKAGLFAAPEPPHAPKAPTAPKAPKAPKAPEAPESWAPGALFAPAPPAPPRAPRIRGEVGGPAPFRRHGEEPEAGVHRPHPAPETERSGVVRGGDAYDEIDEVVELLSEMRSDLREVHDAIRELRAEVREMSRESLR